MTPAVEPAGNFIAVYRCCFENKTAETLRFKYSADCRAQLYLDGRRIADLHILDNREHEESEEEEE